MQNGNMSNYPMSNDSMDYTKSIISILWKFLDRNKLGYISANVSTIDDELVISIIDGKKIKRFKSRDRQSFIKNLCAYLKVN